MLIESAKPPTADEMAAASAFGIWSPAGLKAIGAGALPKCEYLYVQNNDFDVDGKQLLRAAAKARGNLKVHFGWPPPLPGVDYH